MFPEGGFTAFLINRQRIPHGNVNIMTTQINTQHQGMQLCGLMGIPALKTEGLQN